MLNNQEWDKPPRDIFSLDSLIDWLRTKSGDYNYNSCHNCLLAQYFEEMGLQDVGITHAFVAYAIGNDRFYQDLPPGWATIAGYGLGKHDRAVTSSPEWTFEKALERALATQGKKAEKPFWHELAEEAIQQNTSAPKPSLLRRLVTACSPSGRSS